MKTEGDNAQSTTQTPPTQYSTTQWGSTQIPIDPALQQQPQQATTTPYSHYQGYSSHYPQAAYPTHYPYATPAHSQAQTATTSRPSNSQQSGSVDNTDIAALNDALGSAGVDLKAEEESLHRSYDHHQSHRSAEDRTRKQPPTPSFDTRFIGPTMRTIGTQHKVGKIPEDSVNYLALALRTRLQDLITSMIAAAHHRTDTQFDRSVSLYKDGTPMWGLLVRSDVAKQLAALEKVEREEETKARRERKERVEAAASHAAALAAQASGGGAMMTDGNFDDVDGGGAKKKRRKEGPGVTARNMSEDVRKKMSNAVASQAAGLGGKYAWMNAANAPASTPKTKPATSAIGGSGAVTTPATTTAPAAVTTGSWARPYVSTKKSASAQVAEEDTRTAITIRDAMFVVDKERGHGGGRGAARGWG